MSGTDLSALAEEIKLLESETFEISDYQDTAAMFDINQSTSCTTACSTSACN